MKDTLTLKIKGMACASCAQRIQDALANEQDVEEARVDLHKKKAEIRTDTKDKTRFISIIRGLGYDAS
jgi:copper chaperone CopZ